MILVVCAMQIEGKHFLDIKDSNIQTILTGIGKVNAATRLTQFIENNQVDVIYNLGFAGASHHFNVGDVILVEEAKYHDFDLSLFGYSIGEVPGLPKTFKTDSLLFEETKKMIDSKASILYTGDYFMTESTSDRFICDMEGAALYHVSHLYNIPIIGIKIVSDILGTKNHLETYEKFDAEEGSKMLFNIYQNLFKR
jgi:adenosylhomocysteine nucleosidase